MMKIVFSLPDQSFRKLPVTFIFIIVQIKIIILNLGVEAKYSIENPIRLQLADIRLIGFGYSSLK